MQTFDQQCLGCGRHTQNCTGVYNKISHFWDQPAQTNKTWLLQRTHLYKMKGCDPMRVPEHCLFPGERNGKAKFMQTFDQKGLGSSRHTQNCTGAYNKINHFWAQPAQTNKTWLLQRTPLYKMKGCVPMRVPENRLFPGERNGRAKIMQTFDQKCLGSSRHTQNCTGAYNKINNFWAQPAQGFCREPPLYKMRGCDPMRVPENCLFPGERNGKAKKCKLLTRNARSWQTYAELYSIWFKAISSQISSKAAWSRTILGICKTPNFPNPKA